MNSSDELLARLQNHYKDDSKNGLSEKDKELYKYIKSYLDINTISDLIHVIGYVLEEEYIVSMKKKYKRPECLKDIPPLTVPINLRIPKDYEDYFSKATSILMLQNMYKEQIESTDDQAQISMIKYAVLRVVDTMASIAQLDINHFDEFVKIEGDMNDE